MLACCVFQPFVLITIIAMGSPAAGTSGTRVAAPGPEDGPMKNTATILGVASLFGILLILPGSARADPIRLLLPAVVGAVNDVPTDGIGDVVVSDPLISRVPGRNVSSAIVEFDLSGLTRPVRHVHFDTFITASSFEDTGPRTIAISLFSGNGRLDTNDFAIPALRLGAVTYDPTADVRVAVFEGRITPLLNQLIEEGATFAGVRYEAVNFQAPSLVQSRRPPFGFSPVMTVNTSPVPEPTSIMLLGGAVTAAAMRRWKKGKSERL
jgi:PEP-CTERM motif